VFDHLGAVRWRRQIVYGLFFNESHRDSGLEKPRAHSARLFVKIKTSQATDVLPHHSATPEKWRSKQIAPPHLCGRSPHPQLFHTLQLYAYCCKLSSAFTADITSAESRAGASGFARRATLSDFTRFALAPSALADTAVSAAKLEAFDGATLVTSSPVSSPLLSFPQGVRISL